MIRMIKKRRFMRDHEWTHEHLSDYIDGELRERERERVEEHVGMCPQCRRVLATLRKTVAGPGLAHVALPATRPRGFGHRAPARALDD